MKCIMSSNSLNFRVRSSSSDEVYEVVAQLEPRLRITCSCPAGLNGTVCKHRTSLLLGDITSVVEVDAEAILRLSRTAADSALGHAMAELSDLEVQAEKLKRAIGLKKKQVARIMNEGS